MSGIVLLALVLLAVIGVACLLAVQWEYRASRREAWAWAALGIQIALGAVGLALLWAMLQ